MQHKSSLLYTRMPTQVATQKDVLLTHPLNCTTMHMLKSFKIPNSLYLFAEGKPLPPHASAQQGTKNTLVCTQTHNELQILWEAPWAALSAEWKPISEYEWESSFFQNQCQTLSFLQYIESLTDTGIPSFVSTTAISSLSPLSLWLSKTLSPFCLYCLVTVLSLPPLGDGERWKALTRGQRGGGKRWRKTVREE